MKLKQGPQTLFSIYVHDKGADDKTDVYYSNWYGYDIKKCFRKV